MNGAGEGNRTLVTFYFQPFGFARRWGQLGGGGVKMIARADRNEKSIAV
jgi:hypothetical protein